LKNLFVEVFKFKKKRETKKMKLISVLAATTQAFGLFGQRPVTIWGEWGSWSCQNGIRTRQAACLGGLFYCWGPLIERDPTNPQCEPTTIWGRWAPWGACDTTGVRTREAPCLAGAPTCFGPLKEEEPCKEAPLTIWGSWGSFGPCSNGVRTREAPCLAGAPICYGPLQEDMACAPTNSIWGEWSNGGAFGACNPSTGKRIRTKPCLAGPPTCYGDLVEEEMCSARPGIIYN